MGGVMPILFVLGVVVCALINSDSGKDFCFNLFWYGIMLAAVLAFVSLTATA
jgi:hypothetical protein